MNSAMGWFCLVVGMFCAAGFWFAYLVKIVLNDEVVREKKRRRARDRELARRKADDKAGDKRRRQRR